MEIENIPPSNWTVDRRADRIEDRSPDRPSDTAGPKEIASGLNIPTLMGAINVARMVRMLTTDPQGVVLEAELEVTQDR